MAPPVGEVEPQRVNMTVRGTKQIMLLSQSGFFVDEGIPHRVPHGGRHPRHKHRSVLMAPPIGKVEPYRVDMAVGGTEQIVLLGLSGCFVDEGIAKGVAHCGWRRCC